MYDEARQADASGAEAFNSAREACIARGYLNGFIEKEEFMMFYKTYLDYDAQLKFESWEEGREEGREEGTENAITIAIKNNAPMTLIQAIAKSANIPQSRIDELMQEVGA